MQLPFFRCPRLSWRRVLRGVRRRWSWSALARRPRLRLAQGAMAASFCAPAAALLQLLSVLRAGAAFDARADTRTRRLTCPLGHTSRQTGRANKTQPADSVALAHRQARLNARERSDCSLQSLRAEWLRRRSLKSVGRRWQTERACAKGPSP